MKFAHILLAGAAALMVAAPAIADTCAQPAERAALEVHALQSHLAVIAIRCRQDDTYRTFVERHRADLAGAYRTSITYFRRAYGAQAVRRFDMYSTELANAHDQDAARSEAFICRDNAALYQQAISSPNDEQLAQLMVERNIVTTMRPEACAATPARATRAAATRTTRRRAR
ncbi:MAG TPA: hypothetical protein VGM87_18875 [Roseomonas sp.]|jgi:hypothetical protein